MVHRILSLLALVAVILALVFVASAPTAPPNHNGQPTATTAAPAPEPHPQIREAIAALRTAKEHLEQAAHDFGRPRVEELKATEEAIHQLEVCLKYDKD